ncbi:MAG: alpha/beta hydrolase-fold protein [Eubacteriales bacterium]
MILFECICTIKGLYGNNSRFYNETYSSKNAAIAQELTEDMVDMNFLIYLPEDYFETDKRYPVVYLLHQFGSTSNSYAISNVNKIFDEIINDGDMREMIVVCPDSSLMSWWRGSWEDMIIEDLVPYINSNYRTIQDARFQGTAGASMGGQGAYSVAFHNPNYFSNVISFFGAFNYGETNSPNHIAKEEMSDFLQYYNQIFVCGNRDVYGFGTFAIELDQILRDKNVEHYFLIENGGHDDAFYIPLFDDSFIYISDSMYTLADDIEDIINLTVSNNTDNNSLSISAEITIDDKISTYFNKIPDSIYTIDTNPSMTIPVMLKVVQNEKVVYSHMDNSKFIKEATSWSITQTLTEWEMRDIDMESPYTISAIVSVLDKNIIVSINDQIDMESDSIEDGESTNSFGISSYMIMIGGVIVLLVISIIVMKKRRFR